MVGSQVTRSSMVNDHKTTGAPPEYNVGVHKVRSDVRFGRIVRSRQIDKCQAVYESGRAEFSAIHAVDKRGV